MTDVKAEAWELVAKGAMKTADRLRDALRQVVYCREKNRPQALHEARQLLREIRDCEGGSDD